MNTIDWYRMTERPEERELRRKLRRNAVIEWIGAIPLAILFVVLFWLCLAATPDGCMDSDAPDDGAVNDLEERP